VPAQTDGDGRATFGVSAEPGLYQLSVIIDASAFDWEKLYINLDRYGNTGQRTGPWDFDLTNDNAPLVPAFRVHLDGRYVGFWFFQRVSLEDMAHKRFRGNAAFWMQAGGEHRLTLGPYRSMQATWISARRPGQSLSHVPQDPLVRTFALMAQPFAIK
jgi:hypothetical protein